ncbi:uncharacterized protein LOC120643151 [Panicum virgatum]|uniref:uncharacterized protein LOC120643151 n=1 Tax=Panicum virgatum TaxID=38727 RepID=UPI0019D6A24B|nr:uncharacterized protein LOC120643151 [Panicum virgatum]
MNGKVDTAKTLIDLGAQLDVENIYGTPLHIAGFGANLDGVKLMYEKYPEVCPSSVPPCLHGHSYWEQDHPLALCMSSRTGSQSSSITMQVGADAGAVTEYIAMYGCKGCSSNLSRTWSAPVIWKRVKSNRTQMIEGEIGS